MANENLTRITTLSAAFKNAVEDKFGQDAKLQQKAMASLKPGEMDAMQELLMEVSMQGLAYAFGGEPSEDFLKLNMKVCELSAELCLRILPAEKLAECVPSELKNQADVAFLRGLGAKNLADLCEFTGQNPQNKAGKKPTVKKNKGPKAP